MKKILVLVLFIATIYDSALADRVRRFVGGKAAYPAKFPYMVSFRRIGTGRHFCGGSIIHQDFILTAAHCVKNKRPPDFYVVVGTNSVYFVSNFSMHPSFNFDNITDDIAIIKLNKSIKFNKYIQKIPLFNSEFPIGESLTISGYGHSTRFSDISPGLKYANVTAISLKICRRKIRKVVLNHYITKHHFCTYDGPNHGSCHGDSGSPVVYKGKQVGIVSWSIRCANGFPDVHVKVLSYLRWIENTMKMLNKKRHGNESLSPVLTIVLG